MADAPPVQFGIIGCGGAAVPVAEALAASSVAELAAVYDKQPAMAQDLGTRLGADVRTRRNRFCLIRAWRPCILRCRTISSRR